MSIRDPWPQLANGSNFDGRNLVDLVRSGNSPFSWDVIFLVRDIEENLDERVVDIPFVYGGSNHYGFHMKLLNGANVLARLARSDINTPDFTGCPLDKQIREVRFEAAVYKILRSEPRTKVSRLLYYSVPELQEGVSLEPPRDIDGRRLMVFERAEGENNVWDDLSPAQQAHVLLQAAHIRAAIFNFELPVRFATEWLRERLFQRQQASFAIPIAPTRDFCAAILTSIIEAIAKEAVDMTGAGSGNSTAGPVIAAGKQSLLRLIPHILPEDDNHPVFYRLVLEHGNFGIHNMSVMMRANDGPEITSLFDWGMGYIVPAIFSKTNLFASNVNLLTVEGAAPTMIGWPSDTHLFPHVHFMYMSLSRHYHKALFDSAPNYERILWEGADVRRLWSTLRDWHGEDPEFFFKKVGGWAELKMKEIAKDQS